MKKLACGDIGGGDCPHVFESEDFDGFMGQAQEHFGTVHPDIIANVTEEDRQAWSADAKTKFESAPDA